MSKQMKMKMKMKMVQSTKTSDSFQREISEGDIVTRSLMQTKNQSQLTRTILSRLECQNHYYHIKLMRSIAQITEGNGEMRITFAWLLISTGSEENMLYMRAINLPKMTLNEEHCFSRCTNDDSDSRL